VLEALGSSADFQTKLRFKNEKLMDGRPEIIVQFWGRRTK
jgi:hypothetical protein